MSNKGSEWNQWDLHFHTQSSYDYGDKSVTDDEIIDKLKRENVRVVSITDHHIIDVERYKNLKKLGETENITVLPGIEFLSDAKGKEPIHFIAIFSEKSDIEFIWGQIENKTSISRVKGEKKKVNEVYCDLEDTIALIKELGGIVTIHAGKKSNSLENITNALPHNIAQKTDIANIIDVFELGKEQDQEVYREHVFPALAKTVPMILCSDNHNIKKYIRKQKLWIKGSANFEGLNYALNEPETRFFIGEEPKLLDRVRKNKTKYIKSLNVKRTGRKDESNKWFENIKIPLNNELITIIGHKGSGKSALSDIIAMCSDAEHSSDFLFLHKNKFKIKGLAERFSASLEFESNEATEERLLSHVIDDTQESRVRYLPQSYFEKVCNEIGKVEAFRAEIEKVVFQYVPTHKRLNKMSFQDLIDYKKESIDKEIHHLIEEVSKANDEIIKLEEQSSPEFKKSLLSKIKVKESELQSHEANKPIEVENPSESQDSPENIKQKDELAKWKALKTDTENQILNINSEISKNNILIEELQQSHRVLANKSSEFKQTISTEAKVLSKVGIDINQVVSVSYNDQLITNKIDQVVNTNKSLNKNLVKEADFNPNEVESLTPATKLEYYNKKIDNIKSKFTGEQKHYQDYLLAKNEWSKAKNKIIGSINEAESLTYLKNMLQYIENRLESEIKSAREQRIISATNIFKKKFEIKSFYDEIKDEIDSKLSSSDVTGLNITSSFHPAVSFKSSILRNIKQNRSGSFYGSEDGANILQEELIQPTNWNDEESIKFFLNNFISYLEEDKREGQNSSTYIGDIVKDRKELYNFIFSLGYIQPHYDLQQKGKSLEKLSPGEKGALLLVFYLVLDKEDIPLIIDQPEDNLDNNSVAKVLVPYIKEAKSNRQIIMVTHNPNLAVVSDSEQVIKVNIDKENGNEFSFISGGIETPSINKEIVEVLEGTIPAFTSRKDKYQIK